eukprot:scaffold272977_cov51-Attheya_sp.AAC.3
MRRDEASRSNLPVDHNTNDNKHNNNSRRSSSRAARRSRTGGGVTVVPNQPLPYLYCEGGGDSSSFLDLEEDSFLVVPSASSGVALGVPGRPRLRPTASQTPRHLSSSSSAPRSGNNSKQHSNNKNHTKPKTSYGNLVSNWWVNGPPRSPRQHHRLQQPHRQRQQPPFRRMKESWKVPVAVIAWYLLGVLSISTTKLLLTPSQPDVGGVTPLWLTIQQLGVGCTFLRCLMYWKVFGSHGLQPPPSKSFSGNSASFVETIKAAEPITSAGVAVLWGIEKITLPEAASLGTIVAGVLISTWAKTNDVVAVVAAADATDVIGVFRMSSSTKTCIIVMIANLCFSFRGLHQKLLRASPNGGSSSIDDMNLQYRMQQIGLVVFLLPSIPFEIPRLIRTLWKLEKAVGLFQSGIFMSYLKLSIVNGLAFAGYNLASTYVLTKISVVHHAAVNCIRRIFAIIVTSIVFRVSITPMGLVGIMCSVIGFLSFSYFKTKRQDKRRRISSLLPVSAIRDA